MSKTENEFKKAKLYVSFLYKKIVNDIKEKIKKSK